VKRKAKKKGKKRAKKNEPWTWTCDECKARGDTSQCLRPEHCEASREQRQMDAELLRDSIRENGY